MDPTLQAAPCHYCGRFVHEPRIAVTVYDAASNLMVNVPACGPDGGDIRDCQFLYETQQDEADDFSVRDTVLARVGDPTVVERYYTEAQ